MSKLLEQFVQEAARAIAVPIMLGALTFIAKCFLKVLHRVFGIPPTRENIATVVLSIPTLAFASWAIFGSLDTLFLALLDFSICAFFLAKFLLYRRRTGK
jgi:hypothetical protein